jgi:hypothetical protein
MSLEGNEEHRKYQKLVETNQSNLKSLMHFKQISVNLNLIQGKSSI